MLNKNLLMGKIATFGYTQKSIAALLGISKNTFNSKINGKSYFDTQQIDMICDILHINNDDEKVAIFLAKTSHFRDKTAAN